MSRGPGSDVLDEVNKLLRWAIDADTAIHSDASKLGQAASAEARRAADAVFDAAVKAHTAEALIEIDLHIDTTLLRLTRGDRSKFNQFRAFIGAGRKDIRKTSKPRTTTIRACTVTTEQDIYLDQLARAKRLNKSGALRACVQECLERAGGVMPQAPKPTERPGMIKQRKPNIPTAIVESDLSDPKDG